MLIKLAHKQAIEKAHERRCARSVKKQVTITSDEYHQFVVRKKTTMPLLKKQCVVLEGGSDGR
jgi:hypothetical protein